MKRSLIEKKNKKKQKKNKSHIKSYYENTEALYRV